MSAGAREEVEGAVRRLCDGGDYGGATSAGLRGYGAEVFGFLRANLRNETDADDVFAVFAEDLWKSMPSFAWGCSLRTWAYMLAKRAASRVVKQKRRAPVPASSELVGKLVQEIRTETLSYLRTEKKSRLHALRDTLPDDEKALLLLRVDRKLSWDELARVLSDEDLDDEAIKREAARLRKRFQLVKDKLRALATREGLYPAKEK
jgi:RNA polymerase sigma-70 factor (ECF subfamily)